MSLKQKILRNLEKRKFTSLLIVFLITIIYPLVEFILLKNSEHPVDWSELAFHTVVFGFLVFIVSLVWETTDTIRRFATGDERVMRKAREDFVQRHSEGTIVKVLQQWQAEISGALKLSTERHSFAVEHEMLALRSYEIFWELLAAEQRKRKEAKQPPLNVLIIHSSSLEIWSEYAIRKRLLASQRQFTTHGGKAIRILCAEGELCPSEEKPTPIITRDSVHKHKEEEEDLAKARRKKLNRDTYNIIIEVAKSMRDVGIEVLYYNIESLSVSFDFSWDFLYVKETEAAVIWESFNPGGKIKTSTYQIGKEFKGYNLENLWYDLEKKADRIPS